MGDSPKYVSIIWNGGLNAVMVNLSELQECELKNSSDGPTYTLHFRNGVKRFLQTKPGDEDPMQRIYEASRSILVSSTNV